MMRQALIVALAGFVSSIAVRPARADVQVSMQNGRVTIVAREATVRQILTEWARVGQTRIVNVERVPGGPLTLELRDVPEAQALSTLLRPISGYVTAPRAVRTPDASVFDRIIVMPTLAPASAPPSPAPPPASQPPVFPPAAFQPPVPPPAAEDGEELRGLNPLQGGARAPVFVLPQPQAAPQQQAPAGILQTAPPGVFVPPPIGGVPQGAPGGVQPAAPAMPPAAPYPGAPTTTAPVGVAVPGMLVPAPQPQPGQAPQPAR